MTYQDTALWNTVVKDRYTSPDETFFTPVILSEQTHAQNQPDSPSIGLFYDKEEFKDAVSRLIKFSFSEKVDFDEDALDYLFALSNGHPGAVTSIVNALFVEYRSDIKCGRIRALTADHVIRFLEDAAKVFDKLQEGSVQLDLKDAAIKSCYQNGWIHRVELDDGDIAVLPSRLHEKYIEYSIGPKSNPLPCRFKSLPTLCNEILREFSTVRLKHSASGKRISSASKPRPVEAQYQDEFYRAFTRVAGRGVPISSEWSRTKDGRVDFYIPEKKWAIEVLRDHDEVDEHISRFKKGGKYYPWLEQHAVKDWIIIDCATSLPTKEFSEPKPWHAVFANDYSQLQLYNHNLQKGPIMSVALYN